MKNNGFDRTPLNIKLIPPIERFFFHNSNVGALLKRGVSFLERRPLLHHLYQLPSADHTLLSNSFYYAGKDTGQVIGVKRDQRLAFIIGK
jgi:hypothetical protein